ncbi:MAG: dihydrofolate reductase [Gammaproteobacteria bacterium]|nr:dihydrofolate reductase [Gammaproteobacteria bacterium]
MLAIIAAMTADRVIGKDNQMPWGRMPADLKHFCELTMGKAIIMGRKTFESIGKPLPGRRNIVITRSQDLNLPGCEVVNSFEDALAKASVAEDVVVIGGGEIYRLAMSLVDHMYLTYIDYPNGGDTYFPEWNASDWQELSNETFSADAKNPYAYRFVELTKR